MYKDTFYMFSPQLIEVAKNGHLLPSNCGELFPARPFAPVVAVQKGGYLSLNNDNRAKMEIKITI